jgi:hypothetical protein
VAFEEDAELVQRRVGDHVDEHAAPVQVDADGEALREIANGPCVTLPDGDVRQVRGVDRWKGRECAAFSSAVPSHSSCGLSTIASRTIKRSMAWPSVNRRRSRLSATPMAR